MAESAWRKAIEAAAQQLSRIPWRLAKDEYRRQCLKDAEENITAFLASARESGAEIPKIEGEP